MADAVEDGGGHEGAVEEGGAALGKGRGGHGLIWRWGFEDASDGLVLLFGDKARLAWSELFIAGFLNCLPEGFIV